MMKIEVELFGSLNSPHGKKFVKETAGNISIEEFMTKELKYQKKVVGVFVYSVNGKSADKYTILRNGNKLVVLHPVGGG
ncbi:MoaD/ThiS family protein [bacterium]|nr:MoaD/ThiS family protein [bacterium]MBU4134610.1 MoaD/ThiS family protein [bacterium]